MILKLYEKINTPFFIKIIVAPYNNHRIFWNFLFRKKKEKFNKIQE